MPELGEENVVQLTFQHFAHLFLKWQWDVETQVAYLEKLLRLDDQQRARQLKITAFKSSAEFQEVLDNLVELVIEQASEFQDIRLGQSLVMSAEEQKRLFQENYSYLPAHKRLRQIHQRIWYLLRPLKKKRLRTILQTVKHDPKFDGESWWTMAREAVKRVQRELEPALTILETRFRVDSLAWYKRLCQERQLWIRVAGDLSQPANMLEHDIISYEDVAPLLYLTGELEGYPIQHGIQHVVVDEVQDYAPLQLEILIKTYPRAKFTFVGDVFQSLNPYVWGKAHTRLEDVFTELGLKTVRLTKSYRSTEEVFHFCSGLLANKQSTETVLRTGRKPIVWKAERGEVQLLDGLIHQNMQAGYETIAVIGQTAEECKAIYEQLQEYNTELSVTLLMHENATFAKGVIVVPVFLAKGLEFDAVIIPDASQSRYGEGYQRRLLYVACSRALHNLDLIYVGQLSPFIEVLPSELYDLERSGNF